MLFMPRMPSFTPSSAYALGQSEARQDRDLALVAPLLQPGPNLTAGEDGEDTRRVGRGYSMVALSQIRSPRGASLELMLRPPNLDIENNWISARSSGGSSRAPVSSCIRSNAA